MLLSTFMCALRDYQDSAPSGGPGPPCRPAPAKPGGRTWAAGGQCAHVSPLAVVRTRVIPRILGIAAASEFLENSRFPGRATRRRVVTGSAADQVPRGALFSSVFL